MKEDVRKRGFAHFEMIMSFVLFVGFVFFLFLFLTPENSAILPYSIISDLEVSFFDEVNSNLSTVFVTGDCSGTSGCFYIDLPDNLFSYSLIGSNSSARGLSGSDVDSHIDGNRLYAEVGECFLRVMISPELVDSGMSTGSCVALTTFDVGSVVEKNIVSYSAVENLSGEYYDSYEALRSRMNVPEIFDFSIEFEVLSDFDMVPDSGVPDSLEVVSEEYVFEYLDAGGNLIKDKVRLKVW